MTVLRAGAARRRTAGVVLALVLVALFGGRLVRVPFISTEQEASETSVGEIVGPIEVGQFFESVRPVLSGVAFRFATYGNRPNTAEVLFELREGSGEGPPLRTARVSARALRDHAWFLFHFPPVREATGKTFYAAVRSPASRPGNAVSIDFSNHNPYRKVGPSGMVLLRTGRGERTPRAALRPHADLAFRVSHHIRLTERARVAFLQVGRTIARDPRRAGLDLSLGGLAVLLTAGALWLGRPWLLTHPWRAQGAFLLLFLAGFGIRLFLARRLPFTNDEGSILYDAWALRGGRLPGGDGLLKAPVLVGTEAALLSVLGFTVPGLRFVSVLAGLFTTFPLLVLFRRVLPTALGVSPFPLLVAWLLAALPAVFSLYGHAQPLQLLLGTTGLAAFASASREPRRRRRGVWALLAGALFGLALGARKSSVAFAVPAAVLLLGVGGGNWLRRAHVGSLALAGALVVGVGLTGLLGSWYGGDGVRYFLGLTLAGIDPSVTASADERAAAVVRALLPTLRQSAPLLFLGLLGLGGMLEDIVRRQQRGPAALAARLVWLLPLSVASWAGAFLLERERSELLGFGVQPVMRTLPFVLLLVALAPRRAREAGSPRSLLGALLLPLLWLGGTAFLYAQWIKFSVNYVAEFLPAVALLAALGAAWAVRALALPWVTHTVLAIFLLTSGYATLRSSATHPHTGTFELSALRDAAAAVRQLVPPGEPLLTAALAVPVTTGHRVPFDVAHPAHYGYGYIEPRVRNVYAAPVEDLLRTTTRDVRWMLTERLTAFSYFREYPELATHVRERFAAVREIENGSNPLVLLKRDDVP